MKKIIFGTPVHVNFGSFLDLYKGVQKYFGGPLHIYASNQDLGSSRGNLLKIPSKRDYKWRHAHNFIFDASEYLQGKEYDYFVALDSDCLVCGDALTGFLENRSFDFMIYPNLTAGGRWTHGNVFQENVTLYNGILDAVGMRRKDTRVAGNFNPLIVLSKKAVDLLARVIPALERSEGYKSLAKLDFDIGECLIFNILKDAGLTSVPIDREIKKGIRYRPYWEPWEFQKDISIYHPVIRKKNNLFRRLAGIRSGYDHNYAFLLVLYPHLVYSWLQRKFGKVPVEETSNGDTAFNP